MWLHIVPNSSLLISFLCGLQLFFCLFLFFHHTIRAKWSLNFQSQTRETSPPQKNKRACWGMPGLMARPLHIWPLLSWRRWDVSLESLSTTRVSNDCHFTHLTEANVYQIDWITVLLLLLKQTQSFTVFNLYITSSEVTNECCYVLMPKKININLVPNNPT